VEGYDEETLTDGAFDPGLTARRLFLMIFGAVAAVDGLYLHLWKYRLYARPESLREHKLHTAQGALFAPVVFFLFYEDFGGLALWTGVLFLAFEQLVEILDVLDERDSRASLGGLSSTEYALHAVAIMARTAAVALALAAKPLSAWSIDAPLMTGPGHEWASSVGLQMLVGNLLVVGLHLWLMRGKYQIAPPQLPVRTCCDICTAAHALAALRKITKVDAGGNYEEWSAWWEQYQKEHPVR
jgi:hypothetical protein